MRALICDDYRGIDHLRVGELPDPEPSKGTLLVDVESVSVNFADTLMVAGQYQARPETPFAPGHEISGTVIVANQSPGFSSGDRVCGALDHGGMAEKAVVPASNAAQLPDAVGFDAGAVLPGTYGTSYHALVDRARLEQGETLLVLGAAGGVGLAAVQIGKALGAHVVGVVSSDEKQRVAEEAGADAVIRYDKVSLRDGIADTTDNEGVDVVFDPVGGDLTEQALRSTRWGGRLLVIGFAAGSIPQIPLNLPLLKGNALVGVFWGRFNIEEPAHALQNLQTVIALVAEEKLNPTIGQRFGLEQGRDAMELVASRRSVARIVINP